VHNAPTPIEAAARPPSSWERQTVAVLVAIAASGLLGLILLATYVGLWAFLRDDGTTALSTLVVWIIEHADGIDVLYFVLVVAYLGAFHWWWHQTRTMLGRVGDITGAATVHWAVVVWGALLSASFFMSRGIPTFGETPDELSTMFGWFAVQTALRMLAMAALFFGLWQIRAQVRQAIAESGVALRLGELSGKPSLRTSPVLAPIAAVSTEGLAPADDEFWRRAGELADTRRADIAVLEVVDALARRWALIPAGGDVAAVRSGMPAGAVVTIVPEPPGAAATEDYTPPEAEGYHGFLEDAATGALWFQSVTPKRVPAFLARARSAKRWGLYATDAPDALTAVVPVSAER
jgi:hypothetical protein